MIYEQMVGVRMESRPESVGAFVNNMSQFDSFREFMTSTTITMIIDLPFIFLFIIVIHYIASVSREPLKLARPCANNLALCVTTD